MKVYLSKILDHIKKIKTDGKLIIYLEAGHFSSKTGVRNFSINSLNDAIDLSRYLIKKYGKSIRIVFGIFVNDHEEVVRNYESLPKEIKEIIEGESIIKSERLLVFSEKTAKNRGISSLKKLIKEHPDLINVEQEKSSNIYFLNVENKKVIFSKRNSNSFIFFCPGIMGQHYCDVFVSLKKRFTEAESFIIIDWSELLDEFDVKNGATLFHDLFIHNTSILGKSHIFNVFFGDDEGSIYKLKHSIPRGTF